jgi:hypothetical protein
VGIAGKAPGFWVDQRRKVSEAEALTLMTVVEGLSQSPFPNPDFWIAKTDYEALFRDYFVKVKGDPEILLVAGIVNRDDQLQWRSLYRLPEGIIDDVAPGSSELRVLSHTGEVVYSQSFNLLFVNPEAETETDVTAFMMAIPYPSDAAMLQVRRDGRVLSEVNLNTKLLRDAVNTVPDIGFAGDPAQSRTDLHAEIDQIESLLATGKSIQAQQVLRDVLLPHIESTLVGYVATSPLQLEKTQMLEVVDSVLERVTNFVDEHTPINITIAIKPGSEVAPINPKSNGNTPVAILTTADFDASTVDPSSTHFGRNGTEAPATKHGMEDVNQDGKLDLVIHFSTKAMGIVCGDTTAKLTGATKSGQSIVGSGAIKTTGCK